MELKYRVRLKNERVIGPFYVHEFSELFLKGHIVGTELCQQFPIGDWKPLSAFSVLSEVLQSAKKNAESIVEEQETEVPTSLKPAPSLEIPDEAPPTPPPSKEPSALRNFVEFKFKRDARVEVNYTELERKYQEENATLLRGVAKTVLVRKDGPLRTASLDKTVVLRPKFKKAKGPIAIDDTNLKVQPGSDPEPPPPLPPREATKMAPVEEDLRTEETQFINPLKHLPGINAEWKVAEAELDRQAQIEENQEAKRLRMLEAIMVREQAIEDGLDVEEIDAPPLVSANKETSAKGEVKKKRKGLSFVAVLALIGAAYYILEPEGKSTGTGPLYLDVKFPITSAVEDRSSASSYLEKARQSYQQGTYVKRALASGYYLDSLQQSFTGNEAMSEIIMNYAELLNNTKDKHKSANTLYKYIQLSESKLLTDATTATGVARFFGMIGKNQTGIYTVKNYLRAGNKPNPKMLTYYLDLLMEAGELVEAKKVYENLSKVPDKPFESYYYLAKFNLIDDKSKEAKEWVEKGLKAFPSSALLLLQYADILLKEQAVKPFKETLAKLEEIQAERSPEFLASYYHYMGFLAAFEGKSQNSSLYFKKSLAMKESDELRSTLSKLEIGGDKVSQFLILESKVLRLLKKARAEYKNKNIETAFQYTIEAVDANPDYIPAVLLQAQLNADRGYFESTIFSLQRLISLHNKNFQLRKMLAEIYIRTYKFDEADRLLIELGQTSFKNTPDFASLMGDVVIAKKNPLVALKWYDRALALDPLRDEDMYKMAKILVKNKRFPEARKRLFSALLLDPKNSSYHALYAEILYEQDSTDTAIGYLRDTISEIGEDPVLISAIATAYFKSGQLKEFQTYYKRIQDLPKKDEGFYEFLMAAAKLEGRKKEYVEYGRSLLKLNPGNLSVRMSLGEILFEEKRYDEAILEFSEIKDKLDTYPQVYYNLARVYLAKDDTLKAKAMAEKELEFNPKLDSAHYIIGEVYRLRKEYNKAIAKYEKAISLNPKSVDALMSMGWIRLSQNYATEAIELFNRALREEPMNPLLHKKMGDAYNAAGRRSLAREKYEDYLRINPAAPDKEQIEALIKNLR